MSTLHPSTHYDLTTQLRAFLHRMQETWQGWFHDDLNSASQSMALKETHLPRLLTFTMATLSAAVILFVIWAALTPVKEIAKTEGQVLPAGYSQLVQHLEGGLVREILVHEGDYVQKDQVLLRLDGAGLEEDYHEQQALVTSLSLQAERLHAVLENRDPNFSNMGATPQEIGEQQSMLKAARDAQRSERAVLDEQIAQKNKTIDRLRQAIATANTNLGMAQENDAIYSNLNSKGLASRTEYLKKKQELNITQGEVGNYNAQLGEARQELAEYSRRREALSAQQRDTAYTELHKVESELAQAQELLKKRNDRVGRLEVRAPVQGYVKGLTLNTIGAVIPAGQTLMEIVPTDEQLIVEARILTQQIGRVAVGQEVQVKIDSYDYVRFGTIQGKLASLSAMTFTDEIRRQDYYKGRIVLDKNFAGPVPGSHLILPGMTVDADIVTGEKSVLGYLLKPIQVAMHNALTEQ